MFNKQLLLPETQTVLIKTSTVAISRHSKWKKTCVKRKMKDIENNTKLRQPRRRWRSSSSQTKLQQQSLPITETNETPKFHHGRPSPPHPLLHRNSRNQKNATSHRENHYKALKHDHFAAHEILPPNSHVKYSCLPPYKSTILQI